jgi:hypothetical protein
MVFELHADPADQRALKGWTSEQRIKMRRFSNEKKHRDAAEKVERHEPLRRYDSISGLFVHNDHPPVVFPTLEQLAPYLQKK